ncbi:hypothetical protein [Spongiactinospora sp. TRM90649]|uniref:hypothetical protein n=1 Tax=Spongiactinospora sp. TRM90649 TaxID=3031114 RepID=UPI0023F6CF78|nr:hypothetical protein [Spongiactinospora sp. TRM90649]MDF5757462.1 hypothetical protein [Spongiactinospora sp. TRM90649]
MTEPTSPASPAGSRGEPITLDPTGRRLYAQLDELRATGPAVRVLLPDAIGRGDVEDRASGATQSLLRQRHILTEAGLLVRTEGVAEGFRPAEARRRAQGRW